MQDVLEGEGELGDDVRDARLRVVPLLFAEQGHGEAVQDRFGQSVSLFKNTALVGAPSVYRHGIGPGSAYIFERRDDGVWVEQTKLQASDGASWDRFAYSVSVFGSSALLLMAFIYWSTAGFMLRQADETIEAEEGDILVIPAGTPHLVRSAGDGHGEGAVIAVAWNGHGG